MNIFIFRQGYVWKRYCKISTLNSKNYFHRRRRIFNNSYWYPDKEVQLTMNFTRLSTVIGKYISIKKQGKGFRAACPFCKEFGMLPSTHHFLITDHKRKWKCFNCGAGGQTATSFIMRYYGVSFYEAFKVTRQYSTYKNKDIVVSKLKRNNIGEDMDLPF